MTDGGDLATARGAHLLAEIRSEVAEALEAINRRQFDEVAPLARRLGDSVERARAGAPEDEGFLADLFVLDAYITLIAAYSRMWEMILGGEFSSSWLALQDAFDALRVIKRFSRLDASFLEDQLLQLEEAYPYKVFFSLGAKVGHFECSLCGRDIDSAECPHRRGHVYKGVMAHAIARDLLELDHISMVLNPADKRCVVSYDDHAPPFRLVRYIADLVLSGKLRISDFKRLEWSKRRQPNPEFVELGRNDPCFCGSGKKFKHCCIGKTEIDGDHVQVIAEPTDIREALV